jgi:nucleoside-diphosphate-sugar epimerase
MKVLVTGHQGYIGSVMVPLLLEAGHEVVGLDTGLYEACSFGDRRHEVAGIRLDIRDVEPHHLEGFEAVVHLAVLSNDPLGDHDPQLALAEIKRLQGEARLDDQLRRTGGGDG